MGVNMFVYFFLIKFLMLILIEMVKKLGMLKGLVCIVWVLFMFIDFVLKLLIDFMNMDYVKDVEVNMKYDWLKCGNFLYVIEFDR